MSEVGFRTMAERLRERRAMGMVIARTNGKDRAVARAPDGAPCWFIPASAVAERLEQLHPRRRA